MRTLTAVAAAAALALTLPLAATSAKKPVKQPGTGNLSIKPSVNPVLFGRFVTFTGRLTGGDKANKVIELQHDPYPYGTGYDGLTTTRTNSQGEYTVSANPDRNTNYRVVADTSPPARSDNVQVGVRMRINRTVSDRTPARGQLVTFSGKVRPNHDGRRVLIQRRRANGTWRTVARPILHSSATYAIGPSVYSRSLRINRNGVFRVKITSHADHVGNKTRAVRLRVH